MEITASYKQGPLSEEPKRMEPLRIGTFLQAGIVLLNSVSVYFVAKEKSEVREEVEQRPAQKTVDFKDISLLPLLSIICSRYQGSHSTTIIGIDITKAIQLPSDHKVERNLSGRVEIISAQVEFESECLIIIDFPRVIPGYVVSTVATWIDEGLACPAFQGIIAGSNCRLYLNEE